MGSGLLADIARADLAVLISLGSFFTALTALGFQLWNALRIDRAALKVTVVASIIFGGGMANEPVIAVKVVNQGKRPTMLTSIWLVLSRGRWSHRRVWPKPWRRNAGLLMPERIPGVDDPVLPQVLDVGGEVTLFYRQPTVKARGEEAGYHWCHGTAGGSTASGQSRHMRIARVLARPSK